MKKNIITAASVLLLFIPSLLAFISYRASLGAPVDPRTVDKIELSDPAGNVFAYSSADGGDEILSLFLDMNDHSTQYPSLPEPLMNQPFFKVSYFGTNRETVYKYYFSLNPEETYYVDNNGLTYKINAEHAEKFLLTPPSASLYNTSGTPRLLTSGGGAILPGTMEWFYKKYDGTFGKLPGAATDSEVKNYTMEGGIAIDFDIPPDYCFVKIYDGAELLFDDTYDKISAFSSNESRTLTFVLDAKWFEDSGRDYYGEATYNFKAGLIAPAEFYLGLDEAEPGDFVVLTGVNIADINKITFKSTPSIEYEPVFFADGKYVRALIPIKCELTNPSYTFEISYGITTQTVGLTIKSKTFRTTTYEVSSILLGATRTEATIAAFEKEMGPIAAMSSPTRFWDGLFLEGVQGGTIVTGFGVMRTIKPSNETYRHLGVDYFTNAPSDVAAVNAGRVIYTGTLDLSGKTVVIEHGFGLKSWYANLGDITVSVGDMVNTGQVVGRTGATGFTIYKNSAHIGLSVFEVPVCIYPLWENGIMLKD